MNRTEFIGTNLYYSQEFVDDLIKEIKKLKENNKKKTWRCTERNHQIRCRDRKLERRDKKIKKYEEILNRLKVIYTSMQFSAPENMYIFIEQMGDLLE